MFADGTLVEHPVRPDLIPVTMATHRRMGWEISELSFARHKAGPGAQ
jgi:hypothetical protein